MARLAWAVPSFLCPLWPPGPLAELAELAPTWANAWCIVLHAALAVLQTVFLFGIVPAAALLLPAWMCAALLAAGIAASHVACRLLLNGGWRRNTATLPSSRAACCDARRWRPEHAGEQWLFVNGVGTGRHWMQSSLDRLAYTFQRPVLGIHNETNGLLFDLIECLVQRCLGYATHSVRATYAIVRDTLRRPDTARVVLVLHSQGAIVGSMVLDRLLQELPPDLLAKLEIYTFGSAANHFHALPHSPGRHIHIEHYAHATDVVALWGVLHYAAADFAGRVFAHASPRHGGHQFCQHYLDGMFPLARDAATGAVLGCAETNEFMDSVVDAAATPTPTPTPPRRVRDVSRLWRYRNGRCPDKF